VRERAADVDADAPGRHRLILALTSRVAEESSACVRGSTPTPYTLRPRSTEILPSATSAATRSGTRSSGDAVPPPPGVWTLTTSPGARRNVIFEGSSRAAGESRF